jgi:hypothetical protein
MRFEMKIRLNAVRANVACILACLCYVLGLYALPAIAQNAAPSPPLTPKKIIDYGGGGWKDGQVQEPCVMVNPKDSKKLIMFYAGMKHGGLDGSIGMAWADVSDPFTWHEDANNPLLPSEQNYSFEDGTLRLDSVIYNEMLDEYWLYYTGGIGKGIGLATCPAGKDGYSEVVNANIMRLGDNPILGPKGQGREDGYFVSQGAVLRDNGQWYMFYVFRSETQGLQGIRLATSRDGKRWTKQSVPDLLTAAPEQQCIEWHQVYKIDGRYVLLYEGYNGGTRWRANVATSSSLTKEWKKTPANLFDQTKWPNYSDKTMFHVATPAIYNLNNKWYSYFQAAPAGEYMSQHWALWGIECDDVFRKLLVETTDPIH